MNLGGVPPDSRPGHNRCGVARPALADGAVATGVVSLPHQENDLPPLRRPRDEWARRPRPARRRRALIGVAWLALVVGLRWRWRTKVVAALPGVATFAVALAGALASGDARQAAATLPEHSHELRAVKVGPIWLRHRFWIDSGLQASAAPGNRAR